MEAAMKNRKTIKLDRKQLYDEIWTNSLHKTALKYNASEAKFKQACIDADIPLPTLSYWGNKGVGKDVSADIVPLPESDIEMVEIVLKSEQARTVKKRSEKKRSPQVKRSNEGKQPQKTEKEKAGDKGIIILSRLDFYEELWSQRNMAELSRKYDIPVSRLTVLCKASNIPIPKGGYYYYWRKKDPLPESKQTEVKLYTRKAKFKGALAEWQEYLKTLYELNGIIEEPVKKSLRQIMNGENEETILAELMQSDYLNLMDNNSRERIFTHAINMDTSGRRKMHTDAVRYKNAIEAWEKQGHRNYYDRIDPPPNATLFSKASRKRVFALLDSIYRAVEPFDGRATEAFDVAIGKDIVEIEIVEGKDDVPHVMTKEEARQLVEYNDAKKRGRYAWEPKIPKYDHPYNGRLRIRIGDNRWNHTRVSYGDDKDGEMLEDQLGEILITIFEKAVVARVDREKREEEQRRIEEERRRAEEKRQRIELERKKTETLIREAEDYHTAQTIRHFAEARANLFPDNDEVKEWVDWALEKADWIDPTVKKVDEYLGKRE